MGLIVHRILLFRRKRGRAICSQDQFKVLGDKYSTAEIFVFPVCIIFECLIPKSGIIPLFAVLCGASGQIRLIKDKCKID